MNEIYLHVMEGRTNARSATLKPRNHIYFGEDEPLYKVGVPTISLVPGDSVSIDDQTDKEYFAFRNAA